MYMTVENINLLIGLGQLVLALLFFLTIDKAYVAKRIPNIRVRSVAIYILILGGLAFSGYGFYLANRRPKVVEKIVVKPVDRIVEKQIPCPKLEYPKLKTSPAISVAPHGSMETTSGGPGSAAVGVNTGTVNVGSPARNSVDPAITTRIGRFGDSGADIQQFFIITDDVQGFRKRRIDWIAETYLYLFKQVGEAYAISFNAAHGNAFMGCPVNHSADGCGDWQDIQGKRDALTQIVTELRQR
jgi:hypothetical protein